MKVAQIIKKMVEFSNGNLHDIKHFLKVWSYAKTIAELENIDEHTLYVLELACVVHDIACPLCREKYGNTNGANQELESPALLESFFKDTDLSATDLDRIIYLVSHHHTYTNVEGLDYQILLEADFLVNADESSLPTKSILSFRDKVFKTQAGTELLNEIYKLDSDN